MCPLRVMAREPEDRDASAVVAGSLICVGPEPDSEQDPRSTPDPLQIHPRSIPDPPQVQMQIKIRMQIQIQHTVDSLLCYSGSFVG